MNVAHWLVDRVHGRKIGLINGRQQDQIELEEFIEKGIKKGKQAWKEN
jgi:hypothetical protein